MSHVKTIVTVQSVRVANGKLIAEGKSFSLPPLPSSPRIAVTLRDVAAAGRHAMKQNKKS